MTEVKGVEGTLGNEPSRAPEAPRAGPEPTAMPLVDHLAELRRRVAISVLAIAIGSIIGFILAEPLIRLLLTPLPDERGRLPDPVGRLHGLPAGRGHRRHPPGACR